MLFCRKRFIICTDNNIVTYSISPVMQVMITLLMILCIGFALYHAGRYSRFGIIISSKNSDLYHVNIMNKTLTKDMQNLNHIVSSFNNYIVSFDKCGQTTRVDDETHFSLLKRAGLPSKDEIIDVRSRLYHSIESSEDLVDTRIASLNRALSGAGLSGKFHLANSLQKDYTSVAAQDEDTNGQIEDDGNYSDQGGPFIPYNPTQYTTNTPSNNTFKNAQLHQKVKRLITLEKFVESLPVGMPLKKVRFTSRFGPRIDPKRHVVAFHNGMDIVSDKNAKVFTTADGIVEYAGHYRGYGNYVRIRHANGIKTAYGHLSKIHVTKGQKVLRGNLIGNQGNTGRSTGDHLHYEILIDQVYKNPLPFLTIG